LNNLGRGERGKRRKQKPVWKNYILAFIN